MPIHAPRDRPSDLSLTVDLDVALESGSSHSQLGSKRNPTFPGTHQKETPKVPPDEFLSAVAEPQSISHSNCEARSRPVAWLQAPASREQE